MKRRLFALLPFLAAASAQQTIMQSTTLMPFYCIYCRDSFATEKELDAHQCTWKAENGRCPVCGKMAAPWKVNRVITGYKSMKPYGDGSYVTMGDPIYMYDGPTERQERCSRCNASFWTDAEKD